MIACHTVTGHTEQHPLMHEHAAAGRFSHKERAAIVRRCATRLGLQGARVEARKHVCKAKLPRLLVRTPMQSATWRRPGRQPLCSEAALLVRTVAAGPPQAPCHEDLLHTGADQDEAACHTAFAIVLQTKGGSWFAQ